MLQEYIRAVMRQAIYEVVPTDDSIYGEIPGLEMVNARASTLEKCQRQLMEVLEEWIFVRMSRRLPIPEVDGIRLPVKDLL